LRTALIDRLEQTQAVLGVLPIPLERDNLDALCQVGWDLARDVEDRFGLRQVPVQVVHTGRMGFDLALKVYVDGYYVGEGGRRRGFNLQAHLCRGTHVVEVREHQFGGQPRHRRRSFVVGREANCRVEVELPSDGSVKVEVVGSH
jgi:hypothetical protein